MKIGLMLLFFAVPLFPQLWYDNTEGVSVAALGRGGAGIAVAEDPAGVWHNPAGLATITEAQVIFAAGVYDTEERYEELSETHLSMDGFYESIIRDRTRNDRSDGSWSGLEFISAVKPVILGGNRVVLQAGYRRLASFPDIKESWIHEGESEDPYGTISDRWEYRSTWERDGDGGFDDWGMAGAIRIASWLNLGLNLHFVNADYGFESKYEPETEEYSYSYLLYRDYDFSGLLWDLGVQMQLQPSLVIGLVYRSGLDAGLDYQWSFYRPASADLAEDSEQGHTQVHWPDGYGAGLAWQPTPSWLIAMDYSRMNWSKGSLDEYNYDHPLKDIGFPTLSHGQQNADTWKLGLEYRLPSDGHYQWMLRAGYLRQEHMINQMADGGDHGDQPIYKGYTVGAGFKMGKTKWDIAVIQIRGEEAAAWKDIGGDVVFYYDNSMESRTMRIILSGTVLLD